MLKLGYSGKGVLGDVLKTMLYKVPHTYFAQLLVDLNLGTWSGCMSPVPKSFLKQDPMYI